MSQLFLLKNSDDRIFLFHQHYLLYNHIGANVEKDKKIKVWNKGMSSHKIQEALKKFKCLNIDNYCVFRKNKNEDIKIILKFKMQNY